MLTINRMITLSNVSSGYSELYCRSGARSERSRSGNGAGRGAGNGDYRNRLEREAGFSPQY